MGVGIDLVGDLLGRRVDGGILSLDLHLENEVGFVERADLGISEEGDQAALKSAETALDFALCLRGWGDQVGDVESTQGALELTTRIAAIVGGAWAEKAESIGVDCLGEPDVLESMAKMAEVRPGGVGGDEATGDIIAGVVIDRKKKNLLLGRRPPLMDGAIVLPEFAELGASEAAEFTGFAFWRWDNVGEVLFDVGLDAGT